MKCAPPRSSWHRRHAGQIRWHPDCGAGGQRGEPFVVWPRRDGSQLGVDKDAWIPSLATKIPFAGQSRAEDRCSGKERRAHPGKVAIFSTCYVNYNEPGIGMDLLAVLAHNDIPYEIVNKEKCWHAKAGAGRSGWRGGTRVVQSPVLAKYAREGLPRSSRRFHPTLMFKQGDSLLMPDNADAKAVQDAIWDPFEYPIADRRTAC